MDNNYGSLKFYIPQIPLEILLEQGFMISEIANILAVSERTFYRRMAQFSLRKYRFSSICDEDLEFTLSEIAKDYPQCGDNMLRQMFMVKGISVQSWRQRDSIHRLDPHGVSERKAGRLTEDYI